MESYVFSRLVKECLQEKIHIPLQPNEELSLHLIKKNKVYSKLFVYTHDSEEEIKPTHLYYVDDIEYLFLWFHIESINIIELCLILDYDRENETFIHINN